MSESKKQRGKRRKQKGCKEGKREEIKVKQRENERMKSKKAQQILEV